MITTYPKLNELRKNYLNNVKEISHRIEKNYIEYKNLYYNTSFFENLSFKIQTADNIIYCPLTLEKKDDIQKINFYGEPIEIFSKKEIDEKLNDYLINYFTTLKQKYSVTNLFFKVKKAPKKKLENSNNDKLNKIFFDIYINLNLNISEIKSNFTSTLRNELNKNYDFIKYLIIDKKNYEKNEILKMRDLHIMVSGRETRSKDSWYQNERMILDGNGFLVKVIYQNKIISYSFFYFNNIICTYASSCTLRDYFKIIRNINHKSLWYAINYAKDKCDNFFIGSLTKYSKKKISEKELDIEKFKKKFSKNTEEYYLYDDIPNSFSSY